MNREGTLQMIAHYVGHRILKARFCAEDEKPDMLETERQGLLDDLAKLDKIPEVTDCTAYLRTIKWSNISDVESFNQWYEELSRGYHS